jgi:hypothetical protein
LSMEVNQLQDILYLYFNKKRKLANNDKQIIGNLFFNYIGRKKKPVPI